MYAYVAYRIGPGRQAEDSTRNVLLRALETEERKTDVALIDAARRHLDERLGPSDRDTELVALYLVGLDREQIADLLGYRRGAAAIGLTRALSRLPDEKELTWARPDPEFAERLVDDIRPARRPVPRGRRRAFGVAVGAIAVIAAVPALAALIARDEDAPSNGVLGARTPSCGDLAAQLNAAYARHREDQAKLIRRQARQKRAAFPVLNVRQRVAYEARQVREQEALLARQNRELRNLEARCQG